MIRISQNYYLRVVLAFFRNNQFSSAILLAVYIVLVRLPALLGFIKIPKEICMDAGILGEKLCQFSAENSMLSALIAAILVFFQAILINNLDAVFRLNADRSWFPGLFYVLVTAVLPSFLFLSPAIIAITFVPIALKNIFETYKQQAASSIIFDAALWVTVGSLFYPPLIFLLLAAFLGIGILRSFSFKERLIFLSGSFLPLFLAWLWHFWYDNSSFFWSRQFENIFSFYRFNTDWTLKSVIQSGLLVSLILVSIFSYGTYHYKKLIQTQKQVDICYLFMIIGGLGVLLRVLPQEMYWLIITPSLGIFLGSSFLSLKNKALAEVFHLLMLGTILFLHFFPF
jgi:hypothetical protein